MAADDLTPRQRRARRRRRNAPVVPGSQMTNRELARLAREQARVRFGPEQRAINAQLTQSNQTAQAIPGWFDEYRQNLDALRTQAQGAYEAANRQMAALQGQTTAMQGQDQLQALKNETAITGGQVDPAAALRAQQAAQVRSATVGATGGVLANQGFAGQMHFLNQIGASGKGEIEAQLRQAAATRQILADLQGLRREKGAFKVDARNRLRDQEQRSVLERAAFGMEQQQARQSVRQARAERRAERRADRREARREARQEAQEINRWGYTNAEWRSMSPEQRQQIIAQQKQAGQSTEKDKGRPRAEPSESLQVRRRILDRSDFVDRFARNFLGKPASGVSKADRARMVGRMRTSHKGFFGSPIEELMLSAALDLAIDGRIWDRNLERLRQRGIFVRKDGSYAGNLNRGAQ